MQLMNVPLAEIVVGDRLLELDADNVARLVESIRVVGFTSPIAVCAREDGLYDLVSGLHRAHAATEAGMAEVPAMVFPTDTPRATVLRQEVMENLVRRTLTASERVAHFQALIISLEEEGVSHAELLEKLRQRMSLGAQALAQYTALANTLSAQELEQVRGTTGDSVAVLANLAEMSPEARARRLARLRADQAKSDQAQSSQLAATRLADLLGSRFRPSELAEVLDQLGRTSVKQVAMRLESLVLLQGDKNG
jgi:ParB/RepB/Spo0J family partition protein